MGPLGWQETIFIFIFALLIFGPKKLPELGKTVAKAISEFRRASSELKSTFDREMSALERESESLKEVTRSYQDQVYNYSYDDPSYYDSGYPPESSDSTTAANPSTVSASATQGAEQKAAGEASEGEQVPAAIATADKPSDEPAGRPASESQAVTT